VSAHVLLFVLAALLPVAAAADETSAAEKPVAFNLIPKTVEAAYQKIRQTYGALYSIVDVQEDDLELTPPKLLSLSQHLSTIGEQQPAGDATVVYVIGADGTVLLPTLVHATDASVGASLVESAARSRYTPARYRGEPVTAIGGQQLQVRPQTPVPAQ